MVNCAKDEGCDLIIMGSRGQGGVKGFLGSVSYAVTKESPMTVLIAKEGDQR
ncbi:universal stress protein [uncultured Adlercreutzia sp.]|uniref:universal stress protein n=1 Tax=uncultured Adlercreutzia sp. TaxID=875803 RepID=UPI0025ECB3C9|nr:universal stress protein [uncultured Adlercreutzia sp.]